jgi:RHS repeat-associated protein
MASNYLKSDHMKTFNKTFITMVIGVLGSLSFSPKGYGQAIAPSSSMNYVAGYAPRVTGLKTSTAVRTASSDKTQVSTDLQYLDALGRPIQAVQAKGSPAGNDMVQPLAYDSLGREVTKYLPYTPATTADGSYKSNAVPTAQGAFYGSPPSGVAVIAFPYAESKLEPSPLNRLLEQGAPGDNWQLTGKAGATSPGHTIKVSYVFNNNITWATDSAVSSRQVALYTASVNSNQSRTLRRTSNTATYDTSQLYVTVTKDENWTSGRAGTMEEYKDKAGHVVLKRQYNYASKLQILSTYYVYDDMGKLAFVLTPQAGADSAIAFSQAKLDNLCYQYRYDERGRLSQKKLPGKGWDNVVYNYIDEPVATQDSLQRIANQWVFTKFDPLARPVQTGTWNSAGVSRATLQTTLTGITTNLWETTQNSGNGYTNVAWPTSSVAATLTLNFYDTYTNIPGLPAKYLLSTGVSTMTRSLPTVKMTAILNTPTNQLWDAMYYDDLGRTTQAFSQHYLGGVINTNNYDQTLTTYNFINQPTTVTRKHWTSATTSNPLVTIANTYLYDHRGRKLKTWELITNGTTPTTKTLNRRLHSTDSVNFFQTIAYTYNERGWLLSAGAPLFAVNFYYNTLANKAWNGNIRYQYWGTPGNQNYRYAYNYDKLNRVTAGTGSSNNTEYTSYDLNGNVAGMSRYQVGTLIDNMAYSYLKGGNVTNQLQTVNDGTLIDLGITHGLTTYTYDGNGNLAGNTNATSNAQNKSISYNLLNLPQTVTLPTGSVTYTYDATGQKLRKVAVISGVTTTTEYIAGIQYKNSTTAVDFIQTEEGKAVPITTPYVGYDYTYYIGDNLANTRVTFDTKNGSAQSQQITNYYPFGMEIDSTLANPKNLYLYNRKELQGEFTEYDYGARFYDPVIARWNTIDPLSEKSRRFSPYVYAVNNPVRFIDPDGMDWKDPKDQKVADGLQKQITKRVGDEQKTVTSKTKDIAKIAAKIAMGGGSRSDVRNLTRAGNDLSAAKSNIVNLNASSAELKEMGDTKAMTFTFKNISGTSGSTGPAVNGLITMNVVSDANKIHEATHAYDFWKGTQGSSVWATEVKPYQREFSFDSSAVTGLTSLAGSANSVGDINQAWVAGIKDTSTGIFPYSPAWNKDEAGLQTIVDQLKPKP